VWWKKYQVGCGDDRSGPGSVHMHPCSPALSIVSSTCFLFFFFLILLEYSRLTMLYQFQVHSKVNQLYLYTDPSFFLHIGYLQNY